MDKDSRSDYITGIVSLVCNGECVCSFSSLVTDVLCIGTVTVSKESTASVTRR